MSENSCGNIMFSYLNYQICEFGKLLLNLHRFNNVVYDSYI